MKNKSADDQPNVIEDVVAELHRRGVERGEQEYERLVAEARTETSRLLQAAEDERQRLVDAGQHEADRLVEAARTETTRLLQAFAASLPDMFSRRASQLLDQLLNASLTDTQDSTRLGQVVELLHRDRLDRLASYLAQAPAQPLLESLLILALLYYAPGEGFVRFEIDASLQTRLASLLADPQLEPHLPFEFRDGIRGFSVVDQQGRRIEVSAESFKHMAAAWASDEFRHVFSDLAAEVRAGSTPAS